MGIRDLFYKLFPDPFFSGVEKMLNDQRKTGIKGGLKLLRLRVEISNDRKFGRLLKKIDLTRKEADALMLSVLKELDPYKEENNGQKETRSAR
jgi:hypothetical protein